MKWTVLSNSWDNFVIEGDGLVEAIEGNFPMIAEKIHLGGKLGYVLHEVKAEWQFDILDKGGVELSILASPLEGGPRKAYVLWIRAKREDLSSRHYFSIEPMK